MKKILASIIALYTGLIAIACLSKGVVKLMAHGYMSSQDFLYPAKIIFVVIAAYSACAYVRVHALELRI